MIIKAFPSGPFETNAYVVVSQKSLVAAIVDPAPDSSDEIISFLTEQKLKPIAIWVTHSHWDHIAEVSVLKAKYDIPVYIHSLDAPNLQHPGSDKLPCWISIEGVNPDHLIEEGEHLELGEYQFDVIHTPGHSPGCVCFYCPSENILLSGDTLFKGSIGNLSFSTARPNLMWPSLAKLAKLPVETRVFPGHGPSTTIGSENWLSRAEEIFG